ncbi:MAG: MarR family transcriptional regulator, partial [Clostridia bacterium]|nr:MarR family transcriptional regulator [Clostridia bacterium]
MKIYESGEMYLETILELKNKLGNVRAIDIADALGYSKPSVSRALNILKKSEFIEVD